MSAQDRRPQHPQSSSRGTQRPSPARDADAAREQEPNFLDPQGYTVHRLHHATPAHLHLTTRRIFVGPIPLGWLKSHRSEWYKRKLNFHYSKRKASFRADENVFTRSRRLTGLEQEEDEWCSGDEDADPFEEPEEAPRPRPPPRRRTTSSLSIPGVRSRKEGKRKGKARAEEDAEDADAATLRPQTSPSSGGAIWERIGGRPVVPRVKSEPQKIRRPPSSSRTPSGTLTPTRAMRSRPDALDRESSFATAQEDWQSAEEYLSPSSGSNTHRSTSGHGRTDNYGSGTLPVIPGSLEHLGLPFNDMSRSVSETGGSTMSVSVGATNSLASLLRHHRHQEEPDGSRTGTGTPDTVRPASNTKPSILQRASSLLSSKSQSAADEEETFEATAPMPQHIPTIKTNDKDHHVSSGLVRFNTQPGFHEHDVRLQQKLADVSRRRSLRYVKGKYPHIRKREGEIIRMESMLVRIEIAPGIGLPAEYDENASRKVATQVLQKWREYVVVCREGVDDNHPMTLKLYKSRNIPAVDRPHVSSHNAKEIPLRRKETRVNLYSSLDKTLVVWLPYKKNTLIYIMRPRSAAVAVEWYTFLRSCLRIPDPETLQVAVPDLSLVVRIDNPFGDPSGPTQQSGVLGVLPTSMNILRGVEEWADILKHWETNERMGLAWRRYDRLEWVHDMNERRLFGTLAMQRTHELELRPKTHYPTTAALPSGENMEEPPPIEGFLIRLTSPRGRQERLGRAFTKRMYFAVHDNFLTFCKPSKALPPPPPNLERHTNGKTPPASELAEKIPLIYSVAPYPLTATGEISWLSGDPLTPQQIEQRDIEAYAEAERKVNTLLKTEGFVDLTSVLSVRKVTPRTYTDGSRPLKQRVINQRALIAASEAKSFELELQNGLVLRLEAFDEETRDEWITRLAALVTYWRARDREDLAAFRRIKAENLSALHVDEEMESVLGQFARKWEVARSVASGSLHNVCGLSSCRAITLSGVLYRKPRTRATFARERVILAHGELLVFAFSRRDAAGKEVPAVDHERRLSISLRDCYVYSGLITEEELLYRNQTFDSNSPGHRALPRVYGDGYTSQDEDAMTAFVVWHGARRALVRTGAGAGDGGGGGGGGGVRRVAALGSSGYSVVFKARSRVERDCWVLAIGMEIERLNAAVSDEIRVTDGKGGWFGGS